jgi:large subunit ribosomal protein L24
LIVIMNLEDMTVPTSKSPRKQRRAIYNAPLHRRRKALVARLSAELRDKYGVRNLPVRKDDEVLVVDGMFSGVQGKVARVGLKEYVIFIDGVTAEKTSGQSYFVPIKPSRVTIVKLKLDDWRNEILKRKGAMTKEEKKVA